MLSGENIVLRSLRPDDWDKTLLWRNNPEIKSMAMMHPYPVTELMEKDWYDDLLKSKTNKSVYFAIAEKNDNPIGFVFLNNISLINRNCYMGIVIGDFKHRGKGVGTEAIELIAEYAFNSLNLNKVLVEVFSRNTGAIKLYEKLGFIPEGNLKNQVFINGEYSDVLIMSLFKNKI